MGKIADKVKWKNKLYENNIINLFDKNCWWSKYNWHGGERTEASVWGCSAKNILLKPANFLKTRLKQKCFPVNFAIFLTSSF